MIKKRPQLEFNNKNGFFFQQDAWQRLYTNRMAKIGGVLFLFITLACLFGPLISGQNFDTQNLAMGAQPPSWNHWLGTDELGRDLLERILTGGRISIGVGFAATFVALITVSYTHLRAHETGAYLVCRLLLEKKNTLRLVCP